MTLTSHNIVSSPDIDQKYSHYVFNLLPLTNKQKKNPIGGGYKFFRFVYYRTSDGYVKHAYELLMSQMTVDHSEVRLSTFQMIDELFQRSHAFRELLLQDFQTFLELSAGQSVSLYIYKIVFA